MSRKRRPISDAGGKDAEIGRRIRAAREKRGIGLRELARRIDVSGSLISQIELGATMPSVGTLYAIANELQLTLDDLVAGNAGNGASPRSSDGGNSPVVTAGGRTALHLGSGVTWERMTADADRLVDFLHVTYEVGGASCPPDSLMRHPGKEYGVVLSGRLGLTIGFDNYELGQGDSIAFESTVPHRLFCAGDEPVEAVWCVVGRQGDGRTAEETATPDPSGLETIPAPQAP
jgi:DNA-binding XRE family transcriptional regulator/mannose-6-phosphate isomerase-like protein (cupin superfamily)